MSITQNCDCRHRNRHILISMLFLLVSNLTHQRMTIAEGRPISKLLEADQRSGQVEEKKVAVRVGQIGSRPPRCERQCSECARCEAVQVPVSPQQRLNIITSTTRSSSSSSTSNNNNTIVGTKYVYSSRTDDFSNYKPMSWKCKCGNFLFNP